MADFVAKGFCSSERARLIQDQAPTSNVDSKIHSSRFDCCVLLFYSFCVATFATKSARRRSAFMLWKCLLTGELQTCVPVLSLAGCSLAGQEHGRTIPLADLGWIITRRRKDWYGVDLYATPTLNAFMTVALSPAAMHAENQARALQSQQFGISNTT
jgi:hypothetical protein